MQLVPMVLKKTKEIPSEKKRQTKTPRKRRTMQAFCLVPSILLFGLLLLFDWNIFFHQGRACGKQSEHFWENSALNLPLSCCPLILFVVHAWHGHHMSRLRFPLGLVNPWSKTMVHFTPFWHFADRGLAPSIFQAYCGTCHVAPENPLTYRQIERYIERERKNKRKTHVHKMFDQTSV